MKRRGFFGAVAGLFLAPLAAKAKPELCAEQPPEERWPNWRNPPQKSREDVHAELQVLCDQLEDDLWDHPPRKTDGPTLFGIKHFIVKP